MDQTNAYDKVHDEDQKVILVRWIIPQRFKDSNLISIRDVYLEAPKEAGITMEIKCNNLSSVWYTKNNAK